MFNHLCRIAFLAGTLSIIGPSIFAGNHYPDYYPSVTECNRQLRALGLEIRPWNPSVGLGLFAQREFQPGEQITDFTKARAVETPTFLSVQVGEQSHVDDPVALARLNHSNNPNVFVDTQNRKTYALRTIHEGDLLTFWYPSTEWNMVQPFEVFGETRPEMKWIRGAKYIPTDVLNRFRLNGHIERLIANRDQTQTIVPVLPVALGGQKTWQLLSMRSSASGIAQFNNSNDRAYSEMGVDNLKGAAEAVGLDSWIDLSQINDLIRPNQRVLEVGAGYGRVLAGLKKLFSSKKLKVTAIEPNQKFFAELTKNFSDEPGVSLENRNILQLEAKNPAYNLVLWMFTGFADLAPVEQLQAFQRLQKVTQKGSIVVIDLPVRSPSSGIDIPGGSYHEYKIPGLDSVHYAYMPSLAEMRFYAEQSGMKIIEVREYQTPNGGIRDAFIFEVN